jgi:ribosomal protein S18 acetylase RimI-like enzyme
MGLIRRRIIGIDSEGSEDAFFVRTCSGNLPVRRAVAEDSDAVYAIIEESARWLLSRGIRQWESYLTESGRESIRRRIKIAETYLVSDPAGDPIATFALQWDDQEIWGEQGKDGLAGYVHGLAVRRSAAGKNLGRDILDLAAKMIAEKPRPFLRLDCMATNAALCEYYRQAGFAGVRVNEVVKGTLYIQLFERRTDK